VTAAERATPAWEVPNPSPRRPIPGAPALVADVLAGPVSSIPGREALVDRHGSWTYRQLDRLAARAAGTLAAQDVGPGVTVAASLPNGVDILTAFLAAMRLGGLWVGVNRAAAGPEKRHLLDDAQVEVLLADAVVAEEVRRLDPAPARLRRVLVVDPARPGGWLDDGVPVPGDRRVDPLAPATLSYTSGTTGFPKGVVHSQHNLMVTGAVLAQTQVEPGHRKGISMPMTIVNLMVAGCLETFLAGGTVVCMDRADATGIVEWVRRHRVERMHLAPATVYDLVHRDDVNPSDLQSLYDPNVGGGACPEGLRRAYEGKFGRPLSGGYGLTEAPSAVARERPGVPHVEGGSGVVLEHLSVTIAGPDGAPVGPGETGEICVAPATEGRWAGVYRPMLGYWHRPDEGRAALRGSVLHTGDLGHLDGDGVLHVTGRKGDVIVRGGANVAAAEVERVLLDDPRVADCAVIGRPDPRLGEVPVAFVELAPGADADEAGLRERCRAALAAYKVPVAITFVTSWPRNQMGKIVKSALPPGGGDQGA
jgi:acyl-CoA synthetase (AMP-forming)/AMP-acid ligase II